jgi:hypothetical protein
MTLLGDSMMLSVDSERLLLEHEPVELRSTTAPGCGTPRAVVVGASTLRARTRLERQQRLARQEREMRTGSLLAFRATWPRSPPVRPPARRISSVRQRLSHSGGIFSWMSDSAT